MASAEKKLTSPDAATLALWRVAESGTVDELADVLPRVPDINACNEHGVTALMRAAQHGRAKMVRALLEHGADTNIKRNDKFTALALAAFFGHTDVVKTLMEHGADSQASTRGGTSPQMWATARTFNEVVDQLEKPVEQQAAPLLAMVKKTAVVSEKREATPVIREAPPVIREALPVREAPLVVRTLKDPPEIWDLVHEAPRSFDARSAFVTRLQSMKTGLAFRAATAVVLIGMCVVGVLVLRGVQARSERNVEPRVSNTSQPNNIEQPVGPVTAVAPVATTQTVATPEAATQPVASPTTEVAPPTAETNKPAVVIRRYSAGSRVYMSSHRAERETTPVAADEAAQPVAAPAEKSAPVRIEATAKPKTNAPLSPQLITPAKNSTTKAKVIQWP